MKSKLHLGRAKVSALAFRYGLLVGFSSLAAFAQCTFTVTPPSPFPSKVFVDSLGYLNVAHDPLVIPVTASAQTCAWTADATDGFATVSGPTGATGNGSVTYSIPQNTTNASRTVTLNIAGTAITLTQYATASLFTDVPPNDLVSSGFFDGINLMYSNNISKGTSASPLTYGPNLNVTRDQMAVFIVRTILGGGPNVDNFSYSATPYFTDVPPTYPFFKWIQKLRDLGVTAGTTSTTYGPLLGVTRDQMAVFIVRARLGASTAFNPPVAQQFNDVAPTGSEAFYYPYIQELKEIGITSGTSVNPPLYSPQLTVTRGQMAVFLIRAGFNTLLNSTLPLLTQLSPTSGPPGVTPFTLTVKGLNTHFVQGNTTILSDDGVTFGTPTVTDATDLTVTMTIPASTPLGQISITAQTQLSAGVYEAATAPNVFTVGSGDPAPTITSFTPTSGPIGTQVTITGTTLVSSLGTPVTVLVPLQGGGTTPAPVASVTPTSVSFVMPSTATSGKLQLLSFSGGVTSATPFTVTPSSTYTISSSPSTSNVIAGQSTTYTITASSSNGFTGLAQLSLSGLPTGLTSAFNPTQISVGQQSVLTITAPANQTTNTANLAITASAVVDGIAVPAGTTATLNVTPVTTSFLGRTVVDNSANTSLAGVTVTMVGQNGAGTATGCTGTTTSDGSGNFALTNLPASCLGPQLIGFVGNTVTSPAGTYAGLQLVFTLVANTVVVSPVLVHLPRVDNVETFNVIQNDTVNQTYAFTSIPGLSVTVYAGTVFTEQDGSQPNPFPLAAIEVPVDRLPDVMPVTTAGVAAFIVAFQPAETNASQAVAVSFPNTLNTPPGTDLPLMTLDPTLGRMVPYGTGTVSADGTTIIPDINPATSPKRYGIIHFDWHGPLGGAPNENDPPAGPGNPSAGEPVDLASGLDVITSTDISLSGNRGSVALTRTYRTLATQGTIPGPFGWGSFHNYEYRLDTLTPQSAAVINLILPAGTRIPFTLQADGTLINTTVPMVAGWVMKTSSNGTTTLTQKSGIYYQFVPGIPPTGSVLVAIGDPDGNVTNIVRPAGSPYLISEIDDPVGRKLTFQYSGYNISRITDPIGRTVSYTYTSAGYLATFTNVLGGVTTYQYDSQGRVTQITDPHGAVTRNTYDSNGRVASQVLPSGGTMIFSYTLVNSLVPTSPVTQTAVTDPVGNVTTYRFNTQGFVVGVTDATGQVRTITRQLGTNQMLALQGTGICPVCGNTAAGDMTFTYDANGNILTQTDALGDTTTFTYDPVHSNLTSVTDPTGNMAQKLYDAHGNVTGIIDARGNTTMFTGNATGLTASVQDPLGGTTTFTYDSVGNVVSLTNQLGQKTQFSYDGVSRPIAALDPLGRTSTTTYNADDSMIASVDANGNTTQFAYDNAGLRLSVTDPRGGQTVFGYDAAGRAVSITDPLQRTTNYVYDANGNLVHWTNRRGQTATFKYDALNRIVTETYVDATVNRTYDSSGRVVQVVDSQSGTFSMTYDLAGRLVKVVSPNGAISYTRDAAGRVTSRQIVGQPAVNYAYDSNGNLTGASLGSTSITRTFDPRDLLLTNTRSNGASGSYSFDSVGRLLTMAEQVSGNAIFSRSFAYDAAGQLVSNSADTGPALSTAAAAGAFDAANEIATLGGTTYTSDADGNRLSEATAAGATTRYTWDARGRLQAISAPGGVISTFVYDYEGNMIQSRVTSASQDTLQKLILDDVSNIVSVQQGDNSSMILDGRGPDDVIAIVQGNSYLFPLLDQVSSEAALTDGSGNVVGREFYEPYGASTTTGTVGLFQFTGRPLFGAGLSYDRARFYDSATGRFLSEDPLGLGGGSANFYQYVGGNPIGARDPSGRTPLVLLLPLVGGLINGVADVLKAGPCDSKLGAFGRGFVSGALGTSVSLLLAPAGPFVAGAVGAGVSNSVDQYWEHGSVNPLEFGVATVTGGIGGQVAAKYLSPTVGRLPNLWTPRNAGNFGLNSARMLNQEFSNDAAGAIVGSAFGGGEGASCGCH